MKHTYTAQDLIQFIYKETPKRESLELVEQIQADWNLYEEYKMLKEAYQSLPKVTFSPKQQTLLKVLRYSSTSTLKAC